MPSYHTNMLPGGSESEADFPIRVAREIPERSNVVRLLSLPATELA